jgi:preprotein translocase subunit SecG
MQQVVLVIHLMLVLALIGVVLLQRSEGGGLGIGGGGGFMTSRGTANVLTRATAILAGLFFVTSLVLSILAGYGRQSPSILGGSGTSAPAQGGAPAQLPEGGLMNRLGGAPSAPAGAPAGKAPAAPAAPAQPAAPSVPQSR